MDAYWVNYLFRPMASLSRPMPSNQTELEDGIEMLIERLAVPNFWLQPVIPGDYIKVSWPCIFGEKFCFMQIYLTPPNFFIFFFLNLFRIYLFGDIMDGMWWKNNQYRLFASGISFCIHHLLGF